MANSKVKRCPNCSYLFKDITPSHPLCPVDGYNPLKDVENRKMKRSKQIENCRWPEMTKLIKKFNQIRKLPHCKYDMNANNCNNNNQWIKKRIKNCGIMQRIQFILIQYQKYIQYQTTEKDQNEDKTKEIHEGYMEIQIKGTNTFELRYFSLDSKTMKLYFDTTSQQLYNGNNKKYIDIKKIEKICYDINKFEIVLIEGNIRWILRVRNKVLFEKWIYSIKNEWNKLELTLTKFIEILSNTTSKNSFFNLFVNDPYTISNLLDDEIHVLQSHKDEFKSIISHNMCFQKNQRNKPNVNNICKSYKRYSRDRDNDQWENEKFVFDTFETDNEYEIYLQSVFDEMHCSFLHCDDNNDDERCNNPFFLRRRNLINAIDDNIKNNNDSSNNEEETKTNASKMYNKYNNFNIDKYECIHDPLPIEYQVGTKKHYPGNRWKYKCLKDEMIAYGMSGKRFDKEVLKCRDLAKLQHAKQFKSLHNNDNHGMRFGFTQIGVEHIITIRLYCNNTKLCTDFRKSFYIGNDKKHYDSFYWFGRFLHETVQYLGKEFNGRNKNIYIGLDQRVLLPSIIINWCLPVSCTHEHDVARQFAKNNVNGRHGVILEITNLWNNKNLPRYHYASWISEYRDEKELIYCEYHDTTTMIKNIYIFNENNNKWISLQFEIFALNYWCQITMGYAGENKYNLKFDQHKKGKYTRRKIQYFLSKLCQFELDENEKIKNIKSDKLRYIHRQFHHILINKKGNRNGDIKCDINFSDVKKQEIYDMFGQYLFGKNIKNKIISPKCVQKLYPNMERYIDENGKLKDKNGNDIPRHQLLY